MLDKLTSVLDAKLKLLEKEGRLKGKEKVIVDIVPPGDGFGRKIVMSDQRTLLNFASNSYLGISNDPRLIKAAHEADLKFGVGPGAVRFILYYGLNPGTPLFSIFFLNLDKFFLNGCPNHGLPCQHLL